MLCFELFVFSSFKYVFPFTPPHALDSPLFSFLPTQYTWRECFFFLYNGLEKLHSGFTALWKSLEVTNFDESQRIIHIPDLFSVLFSPVYLWLSYLCITGHGRRKEKMASGETTTGTMSGMNCTVRSMTGEEAGVRAGVRAEAWVEVGVEAGGAAKTGIQIGVLVSPCGFPLKLHSCLSCVTGVSEHHLEVNAPLIWKHWRQQEKEAAEDEVVR